MTAPDQPTLQPHEQQALSSRLLLLNEFGLKVHGRTPEEVLAAAQRYASFLFSGGRLEVLPLADYQPQGGVVRGMTTLADGARVYLSLLGERGYAALSSPELSAQAGQYLATLFLEHLRLALAVQPAQAGHAPVIGGEASLMQALEDDRRQNGALVLALYPNLETLADVRRTVHLLEDRTGAQVFALGDGVLGVLTSVGQLGQTLATAQRLQPLSLAHALSLERQGSALLSLARARLRVAASDQGGDLELQGLPHSIEVVLDWPVGHALSVEASERRRLAVTPNPHPAYLADLLDLYDGVLDVPRGHFRAADILEAAQALERGEPVKPEVNTQVGLFPRERQVLRLTAQGHSPAQVARSLGISEKTVANQLSAIQEKLMATSRVGLVLAYLGLTDAADSGL